LAGRQRLHRRTGLLYGADHLMAEYLRHRHEITQGVIPVSGGKVIEDLLGIGPADPAQLSADDDPVLELRPWLVKVDELDGSPIKPLHERQLSALRS